MRLIEHTQFDTVYHEHFSYLSLYTVEPDLPAAGLRVFDVEELPTHGGSLRIYGCHADDARADKPLRSTHLLRKKRGAACRTWHVYRDFQPRADRVKNDLLVAS